MRQYAFELQDGAMLTQAFTSDQVETGGSGPGLL